MWLHQFRVFRLRKNPQQIVIAQKEKPRKSFAFFLHVFDEFFLNAIKMSIMQLKRPVHALPRVGLGELLHHSHFSLLVHVLHSLYPPDVHIIEILSGLLSDCPGDVFTPHNRLQIHPCFLTLQHGL